MSTLLHPPTPGVPIMHGFSAWGQENIFIILLRFWITTLVRIDLYASDGGGGRYDQLFRVLRGLRGNRKPHPSTTSVHPHRM